ncbi:MAG: hypothetical protein NTY64_24100 [Deltaproteobacteria bacterium]|nr:hypothetical protein [Deltaproteobacteria bacterium]
MSKGFHPQIFRGLIFCLLILVAPGLAISSEDLQKLQSDLRGEPVGARIAFWAENFIGLPYDEDPLGEYVAKAVIVADERVDCMYLTFRAVELALSHTPEEAVQVALDKRFHSCGVLQNGKVSNYDDRFQYGEDMIASGKWGREITGELGATVRIQGSRGREHYEILPRKDLLSGMGKLQSGDIMFFVISPEKRKVEECVGHMGVIKVEEKADTKKFFLVHASGAKNKGGAVRKVPLTDYVKKMPFIGVKITRFE